MNGIDEFELVAFPVTVPLIEVEVEFPLEKVELEVTDDGAAYVLLRVSVKTRVVGVAEAPDVGVM